MIEAAADVPRTDTPNGYTMWENRVLNLSRLPADKRAEVSRRIRRARVAKSRTALWSDADGEVREGENAYRNQGGKYWEPLNEAARAAKVRIDRQKAAKPGREDTPREARGKDIYLYARSHSGAQKPIAGPFYTHQEAVDASREAGQRIAKQFSASSVDHEMAGWSYATAEPGAKVDVLYPDLRSPEGSSPFTAADAQEAQRTQTPPKPPSSQPPPEPAVTSEQVGKRGVDKGGDTNPPQPPKNPLPEPVRNGTDLDGPEGRDPKLTSARNEWVDLDRKDLGLESLDGPERRSWQKTYDEAQAEKVPENAQRIAASVIAKPRALTDTETAGFTLAMARLKQEHAAALEKVSAAKDPAEIRSHAEEANRIQQEFDTLSEAVRKGGTESGRSLNARKLTLDEDMSLIAVKSRAKAAKGRDLKPAEAARLEKAVAEAEAATKRAETAEKALADAMAEKAVVRREPGRRRSTVDRETAVRDLTAKAKALLKAGCA